MNALYVLLAIGVFVYLAIVLAALMRAVRQRDALQERLLELEDNIRAERLAHLGMIRERWNPKYSRGRN